MHKCFGVNYAQNYYGIGTFQHSVIPVVTIIISPITCAYVIFLQDALFKEHARKDIGSRFQACVEILTLSHQVLRNFKSKQVISIDYLEAVAATKFSITEFANFVHSQFSNDQEAPLDWTLIEQLDSATALIDQVQKICTDTFINTTTFSTGGTIMDVIGPSVYLLKLLVRQYSYPCLKQASEKYLWIIPEGLRASNLVCRGVISH